MVSIPFDLPGFEISQVFAAQSQLVITAQAVAVEAGCPVCNVVSQSVHSYYTRSPQDLPQTSKAVRLILRVRRFRCLNPNCPKQTFAEPLPQLVVRNAQRTTRLSDTLHLFAVNLSANLGGRMLKQLKITLSPTTLLRLVKRSQTPAQAQAEVKVRVLGVDDFAFRRGHT